MWWFGKNKTKERGQLYNLTNEYIEQSIKLRSEKRLDTVLNYYQTIKGNPSDHDVKILEMMFDAFIVDLKSEFRKTHSLEEMRQSVVENSLRSNMITDNQKSVIERIEKNTPHKFTGDTKQEAHDFIASHIDESIKGEEDRMSGRTASLKTILNQG
jgi:hypothetical protein